MVTAYRTCKSDIATTGMNTFETQQWIYLEQQYQEEVNLRAKLINNLGLYINNLRQQQHEIILMIDANESMTKTNSGISNLISLTQLCDPIFMLHGEHKEPNTYIRGSDRIDYILCTPTLFFILSYSITTIPYSHSECSNIPEDSFTIYKMKAVNPNSTITERIPFTTA